MSYKPYHLVETLYNMFLFMQSFHLTKKAVGRMSGGSVSYLCNEVSSRSLPHQSSVRSIPVCTMVKNMHRAGNDLDNPTLVILLCTHKSNMLPHVRHIAPSPYESISV